jgi:DNA repair ATPase RecN
MSLRTVHLGVIERVLQITRVGLSRGEVRQRPATAAEEKAAAKAVARGKSRAKLSYKETRELEALPKEIEALEAEQKALAEKMSAPEYFRQAADELKKDQKRVEEIEALYRVREHEGKASGTGLGLSICKQIIQGHNGRIEVKSKMGVGTSFSIYLPRVTRTIPRGNHS